MKIYTLKLKTASTTNYSLYDGTTLVSDANLTTLFATEGEAYFTIDLNSLTPTNLTSLTIVNSSDTAVMTNTGLTLVDGKNFKGEWGNSATSFTSFTQLPAYGLDESQLGELASLAKSGKIKTITTADYNWPQSGTKNSFNPALADAGIYVVSEEMSIRTTVFSTYKVGTILILSTDKSTVPSGCLIVLPASTTGTVEAYTISSGTSWLIRGILRVTDNLTSNDSYGCLSAAQGKVLKDLIDSLVIKGSGAPTTSTVGTVGMLYEDTTNGKLYQCTDATNPYVWAEVGGGGVNVVQTTGTSTTDVMSQNAATSIVFADPSAKTNVRIGDNASIHSSDISQIAIGTYSSCGEDAAIAIGRYSTASSPSTIAIGGSTSTGKTTASATQAIAIGTGTKANGAASVAVGRGATASGGGGVSLGAYTPSGGKGVVNIGGIASTYYADYGYNASAYRLLTGLYDPQSDHDAATKGYVDSIYPVGAVFTSTSATAPTIAGGTWTEIGTQTVGSSTVHYYERTA